MPDVGEGVLYLDAFAEAGPAIRGLLALGAARRAVPRPGWTDTLRPLLLVVQRSRSGHPAQVSLGKRTASRGWNGMAATAGQVSCPSAKSGVNWSLANRAPALRTRQALQ